MRRCGRLSLFLCALLAPLGVSANAPNGPGPERQTVVLWGQGFGPDSKGLETLVREFERRNPDLKMRVLSMGAGAMNPQKLMTAIVGNVPPDVINQDRFTISDWANRGAFLPLDPLIERDIAKGDPYVPRPSQYLPAPWSEAMYDGKVYGIPTGADTRALHWNRGIFRQEAAALRAAGLDPERPPRTWSELMAYSRVLTKRDPKTGQLIRAGFIPNYGNSWLYLYAFQNNGSFMSPDGRKCTLYTPETEAALKFMVEGYDALGGYENAQKFQSTFQGNENDAFLTGRVVMKIDGDWTLAGIARFAPGMDWAAAPPPVPDDRFYRRGRFANEKDTYLTWAGGYSYAIPRGARNVEGAWRWIKFSLSAEGRMIEMRAQQKWEQRRGRQFIPRILANREANELAFKEFRPRDPAVAQALRMHIDLGEVARIRPVTFVGQVLWNEHVRAIERASLKLETPKQALTNGQRVVQRELDEVFNKERFPEVDMRIPAWLGLGGALIGIVVGVAGFRRARLGRLGRIEALAAYLFIAPWAIGFLAFTLGPMLASLFFSFTQYNVLSDARWVGIKNYIDLFDYDKANIAKAFSNVLYLGGIGVPLGLVTGLAVALLLNNAVRGMRFYRTLFYMPAIVPGVAATVLWIWILSPDAARGLVNSAWSSTLSVWFGTPVPGWLSVADWAKPSLIFMGLWGAGSGMILWLAGLKGIPGTLYEAASLDGASSGQQFWNVTLPMLSPIVFFNTVMGFIGALQEFDRAYIVTQGNSTGPADSLLVPVYHLFTNGFNYFKMGYASALAWVIFFIILALTLFQLKLAPRWVHYEVDKK